MSVVVCVTGWCAALALLAELRRRARLLADAGHELRGPLTAVSLGLEALRRQPVARGRAEALLVELGRVEAAADDVRAAARGRRAPARPELVPLRELVAGSSGAWAAAAERGGGSVKFDWPIESADVRADGRRLAQAFGNLLANAIEHGGGEVAVRGRRVGSAIRVEVVDGGAPASSANGPSSRRRGRGRGLVISERALRQAGGRLESRQDEGGGRVAVAELPLHSAG